MNIRQDVYKEIADKAAKDESFMNQFKTDPAKAVEDFIAGNCSSEERAEITSAYTSSLSTEEGSRELNESELEHVSKNCAICFSSSTVYDRSLMSFGIYIHRPKDIFETETMHSHV